MTNAEKQTLAKGLFLKTNDSRKQIAQVVGCTEKTLRKWIEDGSWQQEKEATTITRSELLKESYRQLKAINDKINDKFDGVPNKELSDAKAVIRKEIEALSEMPLHQYIAVVTELTEFINNNSPAKLLSTVELLNDFIQSVAKHAK